MTQTTTDLTRLHGRYYTPSFLVQAMLRLALDPLLESRQPFQYPPLRILDPACGDGAFLTAAHERLRDWYEKHGTVCENRLASHLFGVDSDEAALAVLRARLAMSCEANPRGQANFCWGDALTGRGLRDAGDSLPDPSESETSVPDLDWPRAFPSVAAEGGFDLVIGNPPYRRELASKQALERLKQSPLGQQRHQARLDLWGYFLHRGLDLLRDGGRLAFILPSYWTASTAAGPLIERLKQETTIREVILLGRSPIFPGVEGWHLILSLVKGREPLPCRVWDLSESGNRVSQDVAAIASRRPDRPPEFSLDQAELFQHGQLNLAPPDHRIQVLGETPRLPLAVRFDVRQGIVENPRRITRAMAAQSSGQYNAGEGVFVLSAEELQNLGLSLEERELLRPYYRGTDIERYWLAESPSEFLLYLTRETASRLDPFPKVRAHLARFRPLLENRREVKRGRIAWWHLHWPREESLFRDPRLLMPQMGYAPRFVFRETPAFVGFAMHVIRRKPKPFEGESSSLLALTGLLNSELAACWFRRYAKHRGAALDISGTLLKRFPLPPADPDAESALALLVRERQALAPGSPRILELETEIETLVQDWYASPKP